MIDLYKAAIILFFSFCFYSCINKNKDVIQLTYSVIVSDDSSVPIFILYKDINGYNYITTDKSWQKEINLKKFDYASLIVMTEAYNLSRDLFLMNDVYLKTQIKREGKTVEKDGHNKVFFVLSFSDIQNKLF